MAVSQRIRLPLAEMKHYLCPLIGTCLTLKELQKIARRFKYQGETTPYKLHTWLITGCQKAPAVAKYVQKFLTEKYRVSLKRLDEYEAEGLERAWDEAVREGQIAGAFWAIMTRLDAPAHTIERVFGEVHMMSHLQGAEVRAELKEFEALRQENRHLKEKLEKLTARLEGVRERRDELRRTLSGKRLEVSQLQRQLAKTEKTLQSHMKGEELQKLQNDQEILRTQLAREHRLREKLERRLMNFQAAAQEGSSPFTPPCQPAMTADSPVPPHITCPLCAAGQCPGLCNTNILLVGGLDKMTPHYRSLVEEEFGAIFARHNGDLHNGKARLTGMVKKAEIVLCPINVNSHSACLCVKKLCKRLNKPCLMLRKPGLGAVAQALRQLAEGKVRQNAGQELSSFPERMPG